MLDIKQVLAIANGDTKIDKSMLERARDLYYGISLHTQGAVPSFDNLLKNSGKKNPPEYLGEKYQYLFDNFLLNKHPREDDVTRQWRYSQYRAFTESAFARVIELIQGGIFQDGNWDLKLSNEVDKQYLYGNNFDGLDLVGYYNRSMLNIIEDANGYFLRIPKYSFTETKGKVEPVIWFIGSRDIQFISNTDFLFIRGEHLWWVNTQTIFKLFKIDGKWAITKDSGYYAHMMGYMPIDIAGGRWSSNGYYKSWVSKAKPIADEFISNKSAEQLINKEAAHPYIVQVAPNCPNCNGIGEVTVECETCPGGIEKVTCNTCHGNKVVSFSPGQRLEVPKEMMDNDLVKIINHDVSANKHYKDITEGLYEQILEALNLTKTLEAQSGVAKALDQEKAHLFLVPINNDIWDRHIYNTVRDIIAYRNVTAKDGKYTPTVYEYTIVKPKQFKIKTSEALLLEYSEGSKANMPTFVRSRLMLEYVGRQFSGDDLTIKKAQVIVAIDPLCVCTTDEVTARVLSGMNTIDEARLSAKLPKLLDEIALNKSAKWFMEAEIADIENEVLHLQDNGNKLSI